MDGHRMTPVERLGVGLALVGIGIALFMGLPPPWWPDMPPWAVHTGVTLGVVFIFVGAFLVLQSAIVARKRHQVLPIVGMAIFGIGFIVCLVWYFSQRSTHVSLAKILETEVKEPHSNFKITGYLLSRPVPDQSHAHSVLTVEVSNMGTIAGNKPKLYWNIYGVERPSDGLIESNFEYTYKESLKDLPPRGITAEIDAGRVGKFTVEPPFDLHNHQLIMNGAVTLYGMFILIWEDRTLSDKWWWVTEHCTWQR
jgi:hypothetical protein